MDMDDIKAIRDALTADHPREDIDLAAIARLLDALELAQAALYRIAMLNPATDSDEGWNEWGEADCFKQAQKIARASLAQSPAADQSAP